MRVNVRIKQMRKAFTSGTAASGLSNDSSTAGVGNLAAIMKNNKIVFRVHRRVRVATTTVDEQE